MEVTNVQKKDVYLECIAGKDFQYCFSVGDQPVTMGHISGNPKQAVKVLSPGQGFVIFSSEIGKILFDADSCQVPVFLNNREVKKGEILDHDLLRINDSIWRTRKDIPAGKISSGMMDRLNGLIGLEQLHDFKLGNIFSEVFKKHTTEEMEAQLITGTSGHTPYLDNLEIGWGKPWLFARMLGISAALAFILYAGYIMFSNANLVPGLIFIGSFAVPLSTMIFFLEMNIPRNVSIFMLIQLLFVGGIASLFVALVFYSKFNFFTTYLGASAAGIIEESAKLLIVILLVGKSKRFRWILNGLLFGAAVGTGFGAFESAGYAFRIIVTSGMAQGVNNIITRGLLAPFMHVVWTANVAAALWLVKEDKPFKWDMLKEPAFLRIMISMMAVHMIWNAPFSLMRLPFNLDLKYLILGVIAWVICFRLIQAGLKQLNQARQPALPPITV
ncbi:MAG TPA: PrsW family glutamic-type intramembrane protease [Chitinophagaceae bacterium]|nr:PrsW family glutamic-type intramembrane protease [Chitinophagaceae bacterium]